MGNCASPQYTKKVGRGGGLNWPSTAQIIHVDGRLQEFRQPVKASHILSLNPKSFLCSSESMYIDCHLPQVPDDEELQLGQLYFLVPLSKSNVPLSLQELCALASKASASLAQSDTMGFTPDNMGFTPNKTILPYSDRSDPKILATDEWRCKIPLALTQSANWLLKPQKQ